MTVGELPSHNHTITRPLWWFRETYNANSGSVVNDKATTDEHDVTGSVNNTGSNQKHNTVQAYMVAYMYRRTQ